MATALLIRVTKLALWTLRTLFLSRHALALENLALRQQLAVTQQMAAGSVSIHDSFILHESRSHRSGRRRAGNTIRYRYCSCDTGWVDMDLHSFPVFLVRGEAGGRGERYIDLRPDR